MKNLARLIIYAGLLSSFVVNAAANDETPLDFKILGAQANVIAQNLQPFKSPYSGKNSLVATGDNQATQTYGVYLGARLAANLQLYLDVEDVRGSGISKSSGLAGLTNGDALRTGTVDLGSDPYLARGYLRYSIPLSSETEKKGGDQGQLAGDEAVERIDVKIGRMSAADDFDQNRYENNTRTQFVDSSFINNPAWDYAADTRGYSNGIMVGWINSAFALRFGAYQVATQENGNIFDPDLADAFGLNAELAINDPSDLVGRFLAYYNKGRMGNYAEALSAGTPPSLIADEQPGRVKYGFALNVEQPLAEEGETGLFARLGWNDGANDEFMYTEAETHLSLGAQFAGTVWNRADDRFGIGFALNGLSSAHQAYLNSGGNGFILGDGRLNYSGEEIIEAYYSLGNSFKLAPTLFL